MRPITVRVQKVVASTAEEKVDASLLYDMAQICRFSAPMLAELADEMRLEGECGVFLLALAAVRKRDERSMFSVSGSPNPVKGSRVIPDGEKDEDTHQVNIALLNLRSCCANLARYETGKVNSPAGGVAHLLSKWIGSVAALRAAGGQLTPEHEREISRLALTVLVAARRSGWTGSAESLGMQPWTAKEAKGIVRALGQPVSYKRRGL